ncbi:malate dehydrogenase (oxaloacetate-decarboxylating) [Brevibacterium sanguinis]|uniref:Malate dehydrogenase (Oxaloacetate-decarboxylating) n=2 Tax=Brevibacterium TaxID=1696 RepID=A0A366IGJ1_9MICO|nr:MULTISPECIES: NAD-dependent malic enzyme [Brevibacterium]RBP63473.1 malate dehydrogenase (oxaloacetate-decarboxylating) [Brevibacterium sanguinis]RBP69940.1 malate dehydrogenase (oxaloacetate-decarboxylating) [Brevibacterium celere]
MAAPSPGYSITLRVDTAVGQASSSDLVATVAATGAVVTALDVVESTPKTVVIDVSADTRDVAHAEEVSSELAKLDGVDVQKVSDRTFLLHIGGKLESTPKVPLRNRDDLSRAYTPGVARVCKAIAENKADARRLTIKRNTVAVVTDGTAVLGLGDIGPEAAMPVMEGKAVLFKQFAGVDAWPVALDTKDTEEIIAICKAIAPAYGGINLEDISAPRCFEIERRLRDELDIPVFHDDQHGTGIVTLAALKNALKVVGKKIEDVRIVVSGVGAAGNAIIQLLQVAGAKNIIACGRDGAIGPNSTVNTEQKKWLQDNTNPEGFEGSLKEAMVGADVFVGVSAPNVLDGDDIKAMNKDALVFAMANPDPEVDPAEALKYAAVVATGRSDYPNQINNVLAFPGIFRGLLDAEATDINDDIMVAAADAIASCIPEEELHPGYVVPSVFDPEVATKVAAAVKAVSTS